jgi:DNA repair exonuclease SbcCD ATPase subunit
LYDAVTAAQAERDALGRRQEELVLSMQEELLQARVENEDLQEEAESLKSQLFDSVSGAFGPGAANTSPRRHITRSGSHDNDHDLNHSRGHNRSHEHDHDHSQHLQDQRRIADLERVVERQAADGADLTERFEKSRMQVFTAEMALAECKQELAAQVEAAQAVQHQLSRLQMHHGEQAERRTAAHTNRAEDALSDALQKVADCEALQSVQAQLLEQRDLQIQQLTESQHMQQQLNQTLQHQLTDLRSKFSGAGTGT